MHLGHLLVAQAACEELGLCRLFFIPAAQSPFKPGAEGAPAAERLRWLRLALAGRAECEVDDQELRRGGVSYTIETVRSYAARFPGAELFYLIGADHARKLPLWRNAGELAQLAEFVVVPRPGEEAPAAPAPFRLRVLKGWPLALSSSVVRARVQAGEPLNCLTPPAVAESIRASGCYQAPRR